ncbi:AraC family transcriptional regulator [Brevibacillus porteri]|uniref:AraC family transcriptional regulator n=1 Tax=Brevibacillus porteri TaxID=2126350 RepID=UPI003D20D6E3
MEWQEMIRIWNQTPVKLLDIRHIVMKPSEELQSYRMPANAFLFINHGEGKLLLDTTEVSLTANQILHCGKASVLNMRSLAQPLDYYLLLYKPLNNQIVQSYPFMPFYALDAKQPWVLQALSQQIYQLWNEGGELNRLKVTGLFYQFVHETFHQLQMTSRDIAVPELAEQIAAYIHVHYRQAISMKALSNQFRYSSHYLSRVFKRKYGVSPLEYLVQIRVNRAKALLVKADVTIREIAESVGYMDMYYFSRLFKKQTGVTPAQFKMHSLGLHGSNRTNFMPGSFIVLQPEADYIIKKENHYQQNAWSVDEMNVSFQPSFAVTLLFSLSLLLSACSGTAPPEKQTSQSNQEQKESSSQTAEARLYTDGLGRQITIPANPKRAVVITYGGYLLPLGIMPVGVDDRTLEQYPEEMVNVKSIGSDVGNVEAITSLQPDLIILPDFHDAAVFEMYQKIAPTVAVAWGGDPDVVNTLRTIGDLMNRNQEAEAWIATFEKKLQRIRDQVDIKVKPGSTALTFIISNGEVLFGGEGGTLGKLVYEDFGFKMPEQLKQFADGGSVLSMEALVDLPVDYFFTQMREEEMAQMTEQFKEPLYQAVPAVKNKRIFNVTRDKWNYGPYLVDKAVDELIEQVSRSQK